MVESSIQTFIEHLLCACHCKQHSRYKDDKGTHSLVSHYPLSNAGEDPLTASYKTIWISGVWGVHRGCKFYLCPHGIKNNGKFVGQYWKCCPGAGKWKGILENTATPQHLQAPFQINPPDFLLQAKQLFLNPTVTPVQLECLVTAPWGSVCDEWTEKLGGKTQMTGCPALHSLGNKYEKSLAAKPVNSMGEQGVHS